MNLPHIKLLNMRLLFISFLLLPILGLSQTVNSKYVKGQIYVKLKDSVNIPNVDSGESLNKAGELPFIQTLLGKKAIQRIEKSFYTPNSERLRRIYRITFPQSESLDEILDKLNLEPTVEYAERIPILRNLYQPNDYSAGSQYNLNIIDAVHAWDITKGNDNVVVAVVDDAIQTNHEDLYSNIYIGYDATNGSGNPNPPDSRFDHGTHVAGIISARTDNGKGIASLGSKVSIMAIKAASGTTFIDEDGNEQLSIDYGYEGVRWAADQGARIINMSWGGEGCNTCAEAIHYAAIFKECILIASAGNDNTNVGLFYPAKYNGVISVASTNNVDTRSGFSNYGSWVDIAAPGSLIKSTLPNNTYGYYSGTSMASPLVASLAALMLSVNPTMRRSVVEKGLKETADNIDNANPGYVGLLGAGRINAYKAVKWAETVNSIESGSWDTLSNWTYYTPSQYTNPVIQSGHTITVPGASYQVKNTMTVNGSLDLSNGSIVNIGNN